jgi:16S rRNA (uracil1498-N3)-methyltransferase
LDFDYKFIAYENEDDTTFKEQVESIKEGQSIAVLIGAEGGFSIKEVEDAKSWGYRSVSLGKRILRSETAVFYALSTIGFVLENK